MVRLFYGLCADICFLSGIDWTGLTVLSTLLRRWPMDDVDDDCDDDDEEADNACQKQLLLSTQ